MTKIGLQGYRAHILVSEVPLYLSVTRSLSLVQWCAEHKLRYSYYDTLPQNIASCYRQLNNMGASSHAKAA